MSGHRTTPSNSRDCVTPTRPHIAPLRIMLDAVRAVRACALELGDAAMADRLAERIAQLERQLAAAPTGRPGEQVARHPN